MEVILCSLWLGRRLRASLGHDGSSSGDEGGTDIGPCLQPRPIDWAALARAYPSSSKQQQEGEEADKAFRARVRVELDAAWTAMEGEVAGLRRRLGVIEAAAARHCRPLLGPDGIGSEEEAGEGKGRTGGGRGSGAAVVTVSSEPSSSAAAVVMEEGECLWGRASPFTKKGQGKGSSSKADDAHDEAYWRERVNVALGALHARAVALACGKGAYQQGAQALLAACHHRQQSPSPSAHDNDTLLAPAAASSPLALLLDAHPLLCAPNEEGPSSSSSSLGAVIAGAEALYARLYCRGALNVARAQLHAQHHARHTTQQAARLLTPPFALRLGLLLALLVWAAVDLGLLLPPPGVDGGMKMLARDAAFKVFRGLGLLAFALLVAGAIFLGWGAAGIDYRRLLTLPPATTTVGAARALLTRGVELLSLVLLALLLFHRRLLTPSTHHPRLALAPHAIPPLLTLGALLWAARRCRSTALLAALRPTLLAPFVPVTLRDGLVGDVWTSLVRVSLDVAFAALYLLHWLATGVFRRDLSGRSDSIAHTWIFAFGVVPFLTGLPLLCRLHQNFRGAWDAAQRWPHYANAAKYALPLLLSAVATANPKLRGSGPWLLAFFASTLYQTYWDVAQDWGLVAVEELSEEGEGALLSAPNAVGLAVVLCGGRPRLRPTRMLFRAPQAYLAAMALNFVLRFSWSLSLLPESSRAFFGLTLEGPALPTLLAAAEIVRRGLWCLLRLEAAHLSLYRPSKAVGARGGRRARRGNQAEEEEEGEEEGAGVEMVVGRSGGWEGEDEELLWDEEEQEQEQQGPVDVDPLETARLLTQEEARRANPSGHPTGRLVQVNGQSLDPSQLARARKRTQIARECGAMALMLSLGLGLGLLQAVE